MAIIPTDASHPFPIQNIPFGAGFTAGGSPHCISRIGDHIINLAAIEEAGHFASVLTCFQNVFSEPTLNKFMACPKEVWTGVRGLIQQFVQPGHFDNDFAAKVFIPADQYTHTMPATIGDYTDFYASKNHAYKVGCMVRGPENALNPNWTRLPVGYHGRASSIFLSGTDVVRPRGQLKPPEQDPVFGASKRLDYELEIGFFVGGPENTNGRMIDVADARDRLFGLVLLNDWSARDVQFWEYQPLGPFNGKNFCTTISPWVITFDALEPFKCPLPAQDPEPLPYLQDPDLSSFDIDLGVEIITPGNSEPHRLATSNLKYLYWSMAQQLTHHTSTGCNMRAGDLLATGTISGTEKEAAGCLLESCVNGKEPLTLPSGETRTFLEDGDTITLKGECRTAEYTIGFGECTSKVLPAHQDKYWGS